MNKNPLVITVLGRLGKRIKLQILHPRGHLPTEEKTPQPLIQHRCEEFHTISLRRVSYKYLENEMTVFHMNSVCNLSIYVRYSFHISVNFSLEFIPGFSKHEAESEKIRTFVLCDFDMSCSIGVILLADSGNTHHSEADLSHTCPTKETCCVRSLD